MSFSKENLKAYLDKISIPNISADKAKTCEGELTEKELLKALTSMQSNKSPGNDGPYTELYIYKKNLFYFLLKNLVH